MNRMDIIRQRLVNHHLDRASFEKPDEVVSWLGAVQAQQYYGAKWAIAQRTEGLRDADIDQAFAEGKILRTHVMRPTWHFVTPADIRWLLQLTAPRVHAANVYSYRRLALDGAVLSRSYTALAEALQGGQHLTRSELASVLKRAGVVAPEDDRLRTSYITMSAELDGIICSGALRGKQQTYALLDEWAPQSKTLERDEALAELTRRYFTSHGPATIKDFTWWSGLLASDAQAGMEMNRSILAAEVIDGQTYWFSPETPAPKVASPRAHLLPAFDEYTVAYKDHSITLDPRYASESIDAIGNVIIIEGCIAGSWKRTFQKGTAVLAINRLSARTDAENQAITAAAQQYGEFLEMPFELV